MDRCRKRGPWRPPRHHRGELRTCQLSRDARRGTALPEPVHGTACSQKPRAAQASGWNAPSRPAPLGRIETRRWRSEEHTSELQSLMRISYAVFCLKNKKQTSQPNYKNKHIHEHEKPYATTKQ